MSYSICYQTLAFRYRHDALLSDAQQWLVLQGHTLEPHGLHQAFLNLTGISLPRHGDRFTLVTEFGDSNVFDYDGKRARDSWACHGFHSSGDMLRYLGIRWSEDVESGAIKPNGRWAKAESWIRRIRDGIKHAEDIGKCPYAIRVRIVMSVEPDLWRVLQSQLNALGALMRIEGEEMHLTCRPTTAFEWWLCCQLIQALRDKPAVVPTFSIDW